MTERREILLIDDDALRLAAMAGLLAPSGVQVSRMQEAESALAAARARDFDCVLLACERADAASLIARLSSPEGDSQAVVALTEDSTPEAVQPLLAAGAIDWIARPDADAATLTRALRYATARRGYVRALHKAREEAEATSRALARGNREKAMILSFIAHDLRNPFQVLLSSSRALAESVSADSSLSRRAAGMHAAAARAHGVLESLFSWASLSRDARAAAPEPVATEALLQGCARVWRERAEGQGIRLEIRRSSLWIATHEAAAATILRNFVDNALKFTPPGGRVSLSAERRDAKVALTVCDTGVGMTDAQAAGLFALERRAVSCDGGLGLLLCRDLADWIGGELEVESRPGAGSTFRLLLPETPAPARPSGRGREAALPSRSLRDAHIPDGRLV